MLNYGMNGGVVPVTNVGGNCNNNGWNEDWWVILLFALFGWSGNGFGWGGGGNNGQLTEAAMQRGFDTNTIVNKLDGLANGLCDSTYALNNTIQQGNFGLQSILMQGFAAAQAQASDCCCQTQRAIDQVRYDMSTDTCAITTALERGFNAVNQNINDQFCQAQMREMQNTIDELRSQNGALNLAQSQAAQNEYLISRIVPSAEPAYIVPNPYTGRSGYGYGNYGCGCGTNWNNGCGCGC